MNFWNWIGLPARGDIERLGEHVRHMEADLAVANAEIDRLRAAAGERAQRRREEFEAMERGLHEDGERLAREASDSAAKRSDALALLLSARDESAHGHFTALQAALEGIFAAAGEIRAEQRRQGELIDGLPERLERELAPLREELRRLDERYAKLMDTVKMIWIDSMADDLNRLLEK